MAGKKLWPWQRGYKQEQEANLAAFAKAQQELDDAALSKAKEEGTDGGGALGELEKALQEFADLEKSHKEPDGDEGKDGKEGKKEGDSDEDDDEAMEKARLEASEALKKSLEGQGLEAEMVAAATAFSDLQKSQEDCFEAVGEGQELLAKAMATQTSLLLKLCGAMVEFKKGIDEQLQILGKAPAASSGHMNMSFRKSVADDGDVKDRTSVSTAREALQKAMSEGDSDVPMGILSKLDSTQDVGIIPQHLRDKFQIKA